MWPNFGGLPTKGFIDHQLLRRVGNVVITTEDVANFHHMVINNHRKVVRWHPVTLLDDKVATNRVGFKRNFTFNHVIPSIGRILWDVEANNGLDTSRLSSRDLRLFFGLPSCQQIRRRSVAFPWRFLGFTVVPTIRLPSCKIRKLYLHQLIVESTGHRLISVLDWTVRAKVATLIRTFVPINP